MGKCVGVWGGVGWGGRGCGWLGWGRGVLKKWEGGWGGVKGDGVAWEGLWGFVGICWDVGGGWKDMRGDVVGWEGRSDMSERRGWARKGRGVGGEGMAGGGGERSAGAILERFTRERGAGRGGTWGAEGLGRGGCAPGGRPTGWQGTRCHEHVGPPSRPRATAWTRPGPDATVSSAPGTTEETPGPSAPDL